MDSLLRQCRAVLAALGWSLCGVAAAQGAAADPKACAIVLMHAKAQAPQSLAALARKLQPGCTTRTPEMPWSARRGGDGDANGTMDEIRRHVKELRQQGHRRVLVGGIGLGANAAIAYAAAAGDVEGAIAVAPHDGTSLLPSLPALTGRVRQHVPLLWVVSASDPLHAKGEEYAYAKAPPHPSGRYVSMKSDLAATPESAGKPLLEWIKGLD